MTEDGSYSTQRNLDTTMTFEGQSALLEIDGTESGTYKAQGGILTVNELQLFLEGTELVGLRALSPTAINEKDLAVRAAV